MVSQAIRAAEGFAPSVDGLHSGPCLPEQLRQNHRNRLLYERTVPTQGSTPEGIRQRALFAGIVPSGAGSYLEP
jgi:hypothetical protein